MTRTELLPCPFCGGEAEIKMHDAYALSNNKPDGSILCKKEHCELHYSINFWFVEGVFGREKSDMIKIWNTRAIPEGYALVPIEPTEEQWEVFINKCPVFTTYFFDEGKISALWKQDAPRRHLEECKAAYKAMITAVQKKENE